MRVCNLSHTYNAGTSLTHSAIHDVNFELYQGEILGIIGHTGSGKSTLIQHLNGLLSPSSGTVSFRGEDIHSSKQTLHDVRFHVGLVFQYPEHQLFEETVFKDIAFGPRNMGLSESEIESRVLEALEAVGLSSSVLEKSPFELSGGQKRRVAIAGVIAMQPNVLILDEPTAGLDPKGCASILRHIKEYNQKTGASIIIVSHSMEDIAAMADRIMVMCGGTNELIGTPNEIFSQVEILQKAGLVVPQVTAVIKALCDRGLPLDTALYTVEDACNAILGLMNREVPYAE
ncbi:MAG: energy-coupling factor transporter ATPase [Ruminococcaceae bacterium]|nr:energy-coupling factor transporter ATPase [Oscillospiraceae bacterium]